MQNLLANPAFLILAAIIASFVLSSIAEGLMGKGVAALPEDVRQRIAAKSDRNGKLWRWLSYLGFAVLFVGIAKFFGIIKGGPKIPWGLYCVAVGICIICLERVLRSWDRYLLFSKEAKGTGVPGNALTGTLIITAVEIALATVIGYNIFTRAAVTGPAGGGQTVQQPPAGGQEGAPDPAKGATVGVTEKQALEIIGKDKAYLDLLVEYGEVPIKKFETETIYGRDALVHLKKEGLPTVEEMKKEIRARGGAVPEKKPDTSAPKKKDEKKPATDGTEALEE